MNTLRENINYKDRVICPHCSSEISYHVTDIKGVDEKFVICPTCRKKVHVH